MNFGPASRHSIPPISKKRRREGKGEVNLLLLRVSVLLSPVEYFSAVPSLLPVTTFKLAPKEHKLNEGGHLMFSSSCLLFAKRILSLFWKLILFLDYLILFISRSSYKEFLKLSCTSCVCSFTISESC